MNLPPTVVPRVLSRAAGSYRLRVLEPGDDMGSLTELLHRAYRPLLEQGMRYVATHQSVEVTRERCAEGLCLILDRPGLPPAAGAERGPSRQALPPILGTVTLYERGAHLDTPYYQREGVAHFGQFAVDPELQGAGLGSWMMDAVEETMRAAGFVESALDTSQRAARLIEFYKRRGYRIAERVDYAETNYESWVLSKRLRAEGEME